MNDEGVLHKLAKIEGLGTIAIDINAMVCAPGEAPHRIVYAGERGPWNPLESWSDCGPLVERLIRDGWLFVFLKEEELFMLSSRKHNKIVCDLDLKRAICLAIIASEEKVKSDL